MEAALFQLKQKVETFVFPFFIWFEAYFAAQKKSNNRTKLLDVDRTNNGVTTSVDESSVIQQNGELKQYFRFGQFVLFVRSFF